MAAGNTYVAIAEQTLGSAAASVTFSSISGAYTDLVLVCNAAVTASTQEWNMRLNGDTATNYSSTYLTGNGTTASSQRESSQTKFFMQYYGYLSTGQSMNIIQLNNYSNTTTYKTLLSRAGNVGNGLTGGAHLWRSTSAITTILIYPTASTFISGSTFSLYGIAAA
jgi:hypothetical protein